MGQAVDQPAEKPAKISFFHPQVRKKALTFNRTIGMGIIHEIMTETGWRARDVAKALGFSERAVRSWDAGRETPRGYHNAIIELLSLAINRYGGQMVREAIQKCNSHSEILMALLWFNVTKRDVEGFGKAGILQLARKRARIAGQVKEIASADPHLP